MKITALKSVVVAAPPNRNWVFVKVETDQAGPYGWARARWNGKPAPWSASSRTWRRS